MSPPTGFVAHARTGVVYEGQGKHRTILGIPTPEEPTRLVGQLHRLARCAVALGVDEPNALRLATAAALDSVPLARMRALGAIAEITDYGARASVTDVQRALKRGNWWAAKWEGATRSPRSASCSRRELRTKRSFTSSRPHIDPSTNP